MERQTFITAEGYEQLTREVHVLKTVKRKEIAVRIQEAKELGDLSENAEYHEAKNEQAFTEGRIAELESLLKHATIISTKRTSNTIEVGSKIKARVDGVLQDFTIVGSKEADPSIGKISNESPLGQAFLGRSTGDRVDLQTLKGIKTFEVVAIE